MNGLEIGIRKQCEYMRMGEQEDTRVNYEASGQNCNRIESEQKNEENTKNKKMVNSIRIFQ